MSAQSTTQETPTSIPSLKKVGSMQDNLILSIGLTNWINVPDQVEVNTFQSREFGVMVMGERMISSGILGLGMGLGFSSQNFHTNAGFISSLNGIATELLKFPYGTNYDINKMSLNFIDAQLEIRLHSKPNLKEKRFKLNAGMKAGILLQSHTKFKDGTGTYKKSGINNLNLYQYGITSRIGYGNWAIGGYYSLVGIFKDDKGPDLVPYTVGVYLTL